MIALMKVNYKDTWTDWKDKLVICNCYDLTSVRHEIYTGNCYGMDDFSYVPASSCTVIAFSKIGYVEDVAAWDDLLNIITNDSGIDDDVVAETIRSFIPKKLLRILLTKEVLVKRSVKEGV